MKKILILLLIYCLSFQNVFAASSAWEESYNNMEKKTEATKNKKSNSSSSSGSDFSITGAIFAGIFTLIGSGAYKLFTLSEMKIGVDLLGNVSSNNGGIFSGETNPSGIIALEWAIPIGKKVKFGPGIEFNFGGSYKYKDINYRYVPVYGFIKVAPLNKVQELYFLGNLGGSVSYFSNDKGQDGKFFWALGAGYGFNSTLFTEVVYGTYYGKITLNDVVTDTTYTKLGINVGIKFRNLFKKNKQ